MMSDDFKVSPPAVIINKWVSCFKAIDTEILYVVFLTSWPNEHIAKFSVELPHFSNSTQYIY